MKKATVTDSEAARRPVAFGLLNEIVKATV